MKPRLVPPALHSGTSGMRKTDSEYYSQSFSWGGSNIPHPAVGDGSHCNDLYGPKRILHVGFQFTGINKNQGDTFSAASLTINTGETPGAYTPPECGHAN